MLKARSNMICSSSLRSAAAKRLLGVTRLSSNPGESWISTLIFVTIAATVGRAWAEGIYVPNYSFESPATQFVDTRIDSWQKAPQPPSFDTNVFGAWDTLAGIFLNPPATNASHIDNGDGNQLAYLFAYPQVALNQDYNSTDWSNATPTHAFKARFEPGKLYTLTVGVTSSSQEPLNPGATLQVSLYYRDNSNNIVTVAATNITYSTTVFTNLTHLTDFHVAVPGVKTSDPWAGQNIGIQVMSTVAPQFIGGVWDVDNVRFTESIFVPNFSFESPATTFVDTRVDSWQKAPQPPSFNTNVFGAWDTLAGIFLNPSITNAGHIDNCDGNQLAYVFAYPQVALFQDYNSTDWSNTTPTHAFNARFEPGKVYSLTLGVTSSSQEPLNPGATLRAGLYYRDSSNDLVTVAATNITYSTNVFTNLTHLTDFQVAVPGVKASDPWAGQNIGVLVMSTVAPQFIGGVWDIDNIRLNELVAPVLTPLGRTNSQFTFTLRTEPGLAFEILSATNASEQSSNWTTIAALTNVTGTAVFTDTATNLSQRFYRARHSL